VRLGGGYVRSTGQFDPSVFSLVVPLGHGKQVPLGVAKEIMLESRKTFREPIKKLTRNLIVSRLKV